METTPQGFAQFMSIVDEGNKRTADSVRKLSGALMHRAWLPRAAAEELARNWLACLEEDRTPATARNMIRRRRILGVAAFDELDNRIAAEDVLVRYEWQRKAVAS